MPTPPSNSSRHTHHDPEPGPREPDTGRTFTQKLGIFMTGVAIGLMFLGWTQYRKGAAARQIRAQRVAEQGEIQSSPADVTHEPDASEPTADVEEASPGPAVSPADETDPD